MREDGQWEKCTGMRVPPALDEVIDIKHKLYPLKAGDVLFTDLPEAEVNNGAKFYVDIALAEPQVVEGEPLLETVRHLAHLVDRVVAELVPLL
jgi:hypothetical protein